MRPEKPRERLRSAALSRGRMFLKARLDWLPGFPLGQAEGAVDWMCMPRYGEPSPKRIRLERQYLQRATYLWTKFVYRFPKALPHLVDEPQRWTEGVPQLLNWLKGAIHRGELLPQSLIEIEGAFSRSAAEQANALTRSHPALRSLLNALSWIAYLTPSELPQALAWLAANAQKIKVLLEMRPEPDGIVAALTLWEIVRRDGSRRLDPLLRFVGDARAFTLNLDDAAVQIKSILDALKNPDELNALANSARQPEVSLGEQLLEFTAWAASQEQTTRRRALRLFALMLPDNLLDRSQKWRARVHSLLAEARHLLSPQQAKGTQTAANQALLQHEKNETNRMVRRLERWQHEIPPQPEGKLLLKNLREVAAPNYSDLYPRICLAIERLPRTKEAALARAACLHHWLCLAAEDPNNLGEFLSAFASFLLRYRGLPGIFNPWQNIIRKWTKQPNSLPDPYAGRNTRLWPVFFDAVAELCRAYDGEIDAEDTQRILQLVLITGEGNKAGAYFRALRDAGLRKTDLSDDVLDCGHLLDDGRGNFANLVAILQRHYQQDYRVCKMVSTAAKLLDKAGWRGFASDLILDGKVQDLRTVGQHVAVLHALQGRNDPPVLQHAEEVPAWIRRYPAELASILAKLLLITPEAERIAAIVLRTNFPDPEKLQQEIAAVEARLAKRPDDAKLAERLKNLRLWFSSPKPVTAARLAHLEDKLLRATRLAVLQAWQKNLQKELRTKLPALLELAEAEAPEWLFQPRQLQVIASMLEMSRPFRELGIRLLRRRCSPPPWNFLAEPANQAFLTQLRNRGINTEPWVHPPQPFVATGANGRAVRVNFEDDPLAIFHMGSHFRTCLSPGEYNFFSVLANVVDINKHVVYARDSRKQVVGRCLLALSKEGWILAFHPYCHDNKLGFDEIMRKLVEALAAQMGTIVASRGEVPCLVAPDWYDDGPQDLCNRFAFLEPDSEFRRSLQSMEPNLLIATLTTAFAPLPLNGFTLTLILELAELQKRPELVRPLLPLIETCSGISNSTWLLIARLAHHAGALEFTRHVLRHRAIPQMLEQYRRQKWLDTGVMDLLVALEPSAALRVLRRTRPTGVQSDQDETDSERREFLALAFEALGRSVRARRMREGVKFGICSSNSE